MTTLPLCCTKSFRQDRFRPLPTTGVIKYFIVFSFRVAPCSTAICYNVICAWHCRVVHLESFLIEKNESYNQLSFSLKTDVRKYFFVW